MGLGLGLPSVGQPYVAVSATKACPFWIGFVLHEHCPGMGVRLRPCPISEGRRTHFVGGGAAAPTAPGTGQSSGRVSITSRYLLVPLLLAVPIPVGRS